MPSFRKPSTGNSPAPLSSFIGREHAIREIRQLLSATRLVTLTGPGGCGKTRLAPEVAHELRGELEHGIWVVELVAIADPMTVGVKTVETCVTRILNKPGFDSRVQIAAWSVEKGFAHQPIRRADNRLC